MDFKIESPNYGDQRVFENTHLLLAYSGINRMKAFKNSYY